MPRLKFSEHEATVHRAVIVSFDLAGFSAFCNQPEASVAAPRLMKHVFDLLNAALGDQDDWSSELKSEDGKLVVPSFVKFTGDGALMFWLRPMQENFSQEFCNLVVQTMRNFQQQLSTQLPVWEKEWRIHKLPKRARVGIAAGVVYAVRPPHSITSLTAPLDFVGYCINLAVRLQDHCPELGFLVHGVLHPEMQGMEFFHAIKMKGSQTEPVALFREDADRVSKTEFGLKFKATVSP